MVEPVTINLRFLARDIGLPQEQVQAVVALLDDGFPIPFIARYRKDQTNNIDEENLRWIDEELKSQRALCERKLTVLKTIDSLGKLTPELDKRIRDAKSLKRLEDLYLPFKPKKQSLASTARQRGLEPLALEIVSGKLKPDTLDARASEFINEDKNVKSVADALLGAGHIIAETFGEKLELLQRVRELVHRDARIKTTKIETPSAVRETTADAGTDKVREPEKPQPLDETASEVPVSSADDEGPTESRPDEPVPETVPNPMDNAQSPEAAPQDPAVATTTESETETSAGDKTVQMRALSIPVARSEAESAETPETAEAAGATETPAEAVAETESTVVISGENIEPEQTAAESREEASAESAPREPDPDVSDVTEKFQQWKEASQEQGIPVVTSQNTLRKKKKAEAKKKKAEMKTRQQEHFARQFSDYFQFACGVRNMPPHRILAINRAEKAKVVRAKIETDEAKILDSIHDLCVPEDHPLADFLTGCLKDAMRRLVLPSMERELRSEMTDYAERHSIRVFARNLRNLLLQPPLSRKRVLALDPGIRHGCKMVPLDEFGNILDFETVYLVGNAERKEKAMRKMADLIRKFRVSVVAIGNGTGSRLAEECVSQMIATHFADSDLAYIVVNEAGASVYSASPIAKEEFPNYDVLLRGAISIGRRLQDPLNELVKIEPMNLGVGMYQHDLKGKLLRNALTDVVESCVNFVGVDLNTATPAILRYVAGLNQLTAKRIYDYRKEHGPFRSREELKKVPGFGEAAYTHSAGFLKIPEGQNPLDTTWIHPESYELATSILEKLEFSPDDLRSGEKVRLLATKIREEKLGELASRFASELEAGLFTVRDILDNLSRPGRDPRESLPAPIFRKGVLRIEDLSVGMELMGTVLNVVDFGAFIDIGLHDSGLVHISQMADRYIRDAHDRVAVGDVVRVWVVEADPKRKRISLSMLPPGTEKHSHREPREPRENRPPKQQAERSERKERPPRDHRKASGDRPPRQEGDRRGRKDGRRHDSRDRGPKTFIAPPREKTLKPITEEMKKGKEPLRSFGDLAQLLGRVQVSDPAEEKKRKKEEERKNRENKKNSRTSAEKESDSDSNIPETPVSSEAETEADASQ